VFVGLLDFAGPCGPVRGGSAPLRHHACAPRRFHRLVLVFSLLYLLTAQRFLLRQAMEAARSWPNTGKHSGAWHCHGSPALVRVRPWGTLADFGAVSVFN
jgi:hypothetical protein